MNSTYWQSEQHSGNCYDHQHPGIETDRLIDPRGKKKINRKQQPVCRLSANG
jgi:hypothetical protein